MTDYRMKRGDKEYPAQSLAELQQWAAAGNLGPNDSVFNPKLGKWTNARAVPELKASFPTASNSATLITVGAALILMGALIPKAGLFLLLGVVVLIVGVVRRKA